MRGGRESGPAVKASADDYSNALIVNAESQQQDEIQKIINEIDKPTDQPQKTRVFKLRYAIATDVVAIVQNVLSGSATTGRGAANTQNNNNNRFGPFAFFGGGGRNNNQNTNGTVVADARTNSVIVTSTEAIMAQVVQMIEQLDRSIVNIDSTFIIHLTNARADVVAQIINSTFGKSGSSGINTSGQVSNRTVGSSSSSGSSGPSSLGARSSSSSSSSQTFSVTASAISKSNTNNNQSSSSQTLVQGITSEGNVVQTHDLYGLISAIPDVNTNSVIIVAPPEGRKIVENIVEQLDKIPQQVMIETVVVDATLDATDNLGVEWNFNQNNPFNLKNATGAGTNNFGLQPAAGSSPLAGFSYTLTGAQYSAFLNAAKTDKKYEILSTPRIFTTNNAEAEINVSQSVPYLTSQTTDTTGATIANYSFVTVGLVLDVTPRILSNGLVSMDVTQTANDIAGYTTYNAPIINQREADTTVSVRDGETIVLGGIISHSTNNNVSKTPILGDIPLIGNLFKSSNKTSNKTELLVFLTPRIVNTAEEVKKIVEDNKADLAKPSLEQLNSVMPKQ
jgi:general secretion pathway protein D